MKAGNDFEIMPYVGIGKIRFGMTKEEVRATLGVPFESFLKSESSELPTDAFDSLSIHVYYKLPGVCEAIEFGDFGENPTFKGYKFMGKPYKMVEDWLKNLDPDCYKDNTGLTTMKFGFSLFSPGLTTNLNVPVKGVIVFEKGYYDN